MKNITFPEYEDTYRGLLIRAAQEALHKKLKTGHRIDCCSISGVKREFSRYTRRQTEAEIALWA